MASLRWSEDSLRDIALIDSVIAQRIVAKMKWLEDNFEDIVPEKLHRNLKGLYKLRVGDYRVIYTTDGDLIVIQAVGHRRDIYR